MNGTTMAKNIIKLIAWFFIVLLHTHSFGALQPLGRVARGGARRPERAPALRKPPQSTKRAEKAKDAADTAQKIGESKPSSIIARPSSAQEGASFEGGSTT